MSHLAPASMCFYLEYGPSGHGLFFCSVFLDQDRIRMLQHDVFSDDALPDVLHPRDFIHDMLHDFLDDGAKSSGSCISLDGLAGNGVDGAIVEFQFDMIHGKELLVLLDECVLWFREDPDERIFIQRMQSHDDRQTTDEFRDEAEFQKIFRLDLLQEFCHVLGILLFDIGAESHDTLRQSSVDDFVDAGKSAAADEENVRCINLDHFLIRMLSAALRRNAGNSAFQNLQKCLLYAFTGYVSGDGRVFRLPCDLIDFIDVDDTAFRFVDIIVGSLDQAQENVFDVFADIAGFGQGRCIRNRKRNVQETRERLCK